jgi:hypothetical protein
LEVSTTPGCLSPFSTVDLGLVFTVTDQITGGNWLNPMDTVLCVAHEDGLKQVDYVACARVKFHNHT